MSQQLESNMACNTHDPFLGSFQYGGTASLSTGNLTGIKIAQGKDLSGLGRWSWQKSRGQGNASPRIATFYRPVPPAQGVVPGSVYLQHLTYWI